MDSFAIKPGGVPIVQRTSLQRRIVNRWAGAFYPLCSIAYRHDKPGATVALVAPAFVVERPALNPSSRFRYLASPAAGCLDPAWTPVRAFRSTLPSAMPKVKVEPVRAGYRNPWPCRGWMQRPLQQC